MSKSSPTKEKTKANETPQKREEQSAPIAHRRNYDVSPYMYTSPFSLMRRFTDEMDRLFDSFGGTSYGLGQTWAPQVEMFEREGKLVVRADLPGLKKDDVSVDVDDGRILISGERRQEHEENEGGYYRSERSYGSFYRSIPLPKGVSGENAKAKFKDGVLEITMDAARESSGRRLAIETDKTS
jgi:HSP20 family protein